MATSLTLGFGYQATEGPDRTIVKVTNINDSGEGSLREALALDYPREIHFLVYGNIELTEDLEVTSPYVTIDGSTAPGGGICLKNYGLNIRTHHFVIQHLRVRPGAACNGQVNGILCYENSQHGVISNSSFSWATDENVTLYGCQDITVQYCIISEGLSDSVHPEGAHSKNIYWSRPTCNNITMHNCLLAHSTDRNPEIYIGACEVINNIIYNVFRPTDVIPVHGVVYLNYIGNQAIAGVNTWSDKDPTYRYMMRVREREFTEDTEIYLENNICGTRPTDDLAEDLIMPIAERVYVVEDKFDYGDTVPVVDVFDAYVPILANAGATLPNRDAVDRRIIRDVKAQTGSIIDDPSEVGGWPSLKPSRKKFNLKCLPPFMRKGYDRRKWQR